MLIATLPTLTGRETQALSEKILEESSIDAVRYNTGGASPYTPEEILKILKSIADRYGKPIYIDLEGRQVRVAHWTPFSRGVVTLNRDFLIKLPGRIHFRRAGWCDIVNALPKERKIFFQHDDRPKNEYYLGESQSVNIVAENFEVTGYLQDLDFKYIKSAADLGMSHFMLSFVEELQDASEFYGAYRACAAGRDLPDPKLVLKIESRKGIEFAKNLSKKLLSKLQLMAARDDLFLSFVEKRSEFLDALRLIVKKDKNAILASKIMSGLLEYPFEVTVGDMADMKLMSEFGYRHYMFPDELADCFNLATRSWEEVILPNTKGTKAWKKK